MKRTRVRFENPEGETLSGLIDWPVGRAPLAFALFAHCFTCTKNIRAATHISEALAHAGIAVMRFDFTGLGQSEGEFADSNFSGNVQDLICAAEYLRRTHSAPKILVGHSLGGTAVLHAAQSIQESEAVATIGSPADAAHVAHLVRSKRAEIDARGEAEVLLAGRPFTIKKQFLDDIEAQPAPQTLKNLNRALAVFHSPIDTIVDVSNAAEIFTNARHPKSFISLDQADHLLSREEDARYVGAVLAAWAARFIDARGEDNALAEQEGRVVARTESGFRTEINADGHPLAADEPNSVGGDDTAPTPYGLLSAALAACSSMTVRMYADRKGLPLESVTVSVSHGKVHAEDCVQCETKTGRIDRFEKTVEVEGSLDQSQRQRLLEIADRCPVHRTLHSEVLIETRSENDN